MLKDFTKEELKQFLKDNFHDIIDILAELINEKWGQLQ